MRTCIVCLQASATTRPLPSDHPTTGDHLCIPCVNLIVAAPEPVRRGDWIFTVQRGQDQRAPFVVCTNTRTQRTLKIPAPLPLKQERWPEDAST